MIPRAGAAAILLLLAVVAITNRNKILESSTHETLSLDEHTENLKSYKGHDVLYSSWPRATSPTSGSTVSLIHSSKYYKATGRKIGAEYSSDIGVLVQVLDPDTSFSLSSGPLAYWFIDGELMTTTPTSTFTHEFSKIKHHTLVAKTTDGDEYEFDINVKIVRWEIRDLSDEDRNRYLSALHRLYQIGQSAGMETYGDSFMSGSELIRIHIMGAADKDCDHWHDDMGMLNHHVGITWKMEQSLRMIDPTVSSAYWDYTRQEDLVWFDSDIFSDDWFGTGSPANEDHILDTGRWAYLPVMTNAQAFSSITNPYGLLRSPWNTNHVPYLLRSNTTVGIFADGNMMFPTCAEFSTTLDEDLGASMNRLNGLLHGPVHIMIGGHWGMGQLWEEVMNSAVTGSNQASEILLTAKYLWRQGVIRSPDYCSYDTKAEDCIMSCPDEIVGKFSAEEMASEFGVSETSDVWPTIFPQAKARGLSTEQIKDFMCGVFYPGEMFTSAAPQDPLFWPLHGNAERFIQLKFRLREEEYLDFDLDWAYQHVSDVPSDTHHICDWSNVEGLEMPTCTPGTCSGHKSQDLLPFSGLLESDPEDKLYTNLDFLHLIEPSTDKAPYVYDSLNYWDGCLGGSMLLQYNYMEDQEQIPTKRQ